MTKSEIIAAANAKPPSDEPAHRIALVPIVREDLLAALDGAKGARAAELLAGASNAGAKSVLFCQREHILEALQTPNEPAEV